MGYLKCSCWLQLNINYGATIICKSECTQYLKNSSIWKLEDSGFSYIPNEIYKECRFRNANWMHLPTDWILLTPNLLSKKGILVTPNHVFHTDIFKTISFLLRSKRLMNNSSRIDFQSDLQTESNIFQNTINTNNESILRTAWKINCREKERKELEWILSDLWYSNG